MWNEINIQVLLFVELVRACFTGMFVVSVELVRDATRRVGSHRGSARYGGQAL